MLEHRVKGHKLYKGNYKGIFDNPYENVHLDIDIHKDKDCQATKYQKVISEAKPKEWQQAKN